MVIVTMKKLNIISNYGINEIKSHFKLGQTNYVKQICQELGEIKNRGLQNLTPEYVSNLENRLVTSQIDFLLDHDNNEHYYSEMFSQLGISRGSQVNPHEILPIISYSVESLIGDNMKHMVIQGVQGGRVFESSGTTNPEGKKKVYYDELTCVILRELMKLSWEYVDGRQMAPNDNLLLFNAARIDLRYALCGFCCTLL